jgi:hypothetical protein
VIGASSDRHRSRYGVIDTRVVEDAGPSAIAPLAIAWKNAAAGDPVRSETAICPGRAREPSTRGGRAATVSLYPHHRR